MAVADGQPHRPRSPPRTSPSPSARHADAKSALLSPVLAATPSAVTIFWPERLAWIDAQPGARHHRVEQLLVGRILLGAPHEIAVVVLGTVSEQYDQASPASRREDLVVVGACSTPGSSAQPHLASRSATELWLEVDLPPSSFGHAGACKLWRHSPCRPIHLRSIRMAGNRTSARCPPVDPQTTVSVIYYRAPDAEMLQYLALEPLRLGPVSGSRLAVLGALLLDDATIDAFFDARDSHYGATPLQRRLVKLVMLDPARWTELISDDPASGRWPEGTAFRRAIQCINSAGRSPQLARRHDEGVGAVSMDVTASMRLLDAMVRPALAVAEAIHRLLNAKLAVPFRKGNRPTLTTISASARQLDARLSQLLVAPRLATRLRSLRKRQVLPTSDLSAPYIGLWNSVWLVANDVILGYAVSVLLVNHRFAIAEALRYGLRRAFVDDVLRLLDWLGDWPAGLKLNTELSLFFQDAYSSFIVAWRDQVLDAVAPHLEGVVVAVALASRLMGITMSLCLLDDAVQLLTLHITVFHGCARRVFRFLVTVLSSLFDLFRGKKRNALRGGRLDDATYELDQLLLGTILFTLCAFLVPTCYVFYLAFAVIRLGVVAFEAVVVETLLGLLNHLPLFALMLRFKDPSRLPASVRLEPLAASSGVEGHRRRYVAAHHLALRSNALGVVDIFEGYSDHVRGILDLPRMAARTLLGHSLRRDRHR
ncbi:uncharacterized protein PFL1_00562 [Pseudozyma flocculosa PF-1]|uniref:Related to GPI1 - required for N-acetylglucosaminyl phosphatidylinositol synthesis n=1 Tax=Pseudozyma flocculosa TaxID=84751 RepID=A0A5C3EQS0_9BASI|nr:uncharacterized protein PFL1_00562 [Pseudozyma flocculosa PF-1]EPQ32366.1 hypothetical protein PFL1_00562 [Pseudozyma flocculosa PF-1]SPO34663.1 related to GPI1 - required for N-acetylglucosaminyl phosphatidylinositol synthesis [Pseudozyma flocculosa]